MPTGTHGSFVWYDLLTLDRAAAAAFYRDVGGWTSQPFPESGVAYTMFVGAQGPLAGTTKPEQAGVRAQWVANVFVDDVDATAALAAKLGGRVWASPADEAAFAYYSQLFGWKKLRDFDMGDMGKYLIYGQGQGSDDRELGGMFSKAKDAPMPAAWVYYIQVADLDAAVARAKGRGGTLMNGPMAVPGGARIAQLTDPQGACFALHENAQPKAAA